MSGHALPVRVGPGRSEILRAGARMQLLTIRRNAVVPILTVIQPAAFYVIVNASRPPSSTGAERLGRLAATLLTSLWGATVWACGGILRREIGEGTLGRSLTGVADARLVLLGKCLGAIGLIGFLLVCTGTVLGLAVGATLTPSAIPALFLALVLVAASGIGMGFALSSVFLMTRHAVQVTAALTYPVYILAGLLIPAAQLPVPLSWCCRLVSLYWAQQSIDAGLLGGTGAAVDLAIVAALSACYYVAGRALFAVVVDRARRKGTIDLG